MVSPTYPGVYMEEVSSGVRPIAAASTSTAAFIGQAEKGAIGEAVKIYNFTEFQNLYGDYLSSSYLAHSVFQYFNNGGSKCYIIRVTGENTETASIDLFDRDDVTSLRSMTISAKNAGVWGNSLGIVIANGTRDSNNEFNLSIFRESDDTLLESYENLSMVPGFSNYIETAISGSHLIHVEVNDANTNADAGTSTGFEAPVSLDGTGRTFFKINVNGDGYQEIDLQLAVTSGDVANLSTPALIASAIRLRVRALLRQRASSSQFAFDDFTVTTGTGDELILTSGVAGVGSSVNISAGSSAATNAAALLNLGSLNEGSEVVGGAVLRPRANPDTVTYYLLGDHAVPTTEVQAVTGGSDGDPATDLDYRNSFPVLDNVADVSLIAVPGIGSASVIQEGMSYCEITRPLSDCFYIADMPADNDTVTEATALVGSLSPKNSYGAIYTPWPIIPHPTDGGAEPIPVPPSGFVAGMYAKTDSKRGVWKAPAGIGTGLAGTSGLMVDFSDVQQGDLNPISVNVIRQFAASGRVIWGSRTINSDVEYKYIPVRRMAIFLRGSIYYGIQWAVFEPNDEPLWGLLRTNISSFMMNLFRRGAFQGSKASDAFFVKCDSETTTQADIDLGIVNVQIGFAPLKPAEFIIVQISQKAGQSA